MPGPLIAFWVLIGLGCGLTLTDKEAPIYGHPDYNSVSSGRLPKARPYSWLSTPSHQIAVRDVYGVEQCSAVVFAVTGKGRVMRVEIDGAEQLLDSSWAVDVTAKPFEQRLITVRYRNPVGGKEVACHSLSFICVPETWDGRVRQVVSNGESCE